MEDKQLAINSFVIPVIVALDNINTSRPHHSHDRTFRDRTSRPHYNLTGKCIICPNLDGIEDLFQDKVTTEEFQRQPTTLESPDLLIGKENHKQ